MNGSIKAVVLAAGKSQRMKSNRTKMVHKILGKEIINYLLDSLVQVGIEESDIIVVAGDNLAHLREVIDRKVHYAVQDKQLGTAHALLCAGKEIQNHPGDLLVTVGDNPYISAGELDQLIDTHRKNRSVCTFISAIFAAQPPPYGRVIRDEAGHILDVVEEIHATPEQLTIREVNSSIYIFSNPIVFPLLSKIDNKNIKHEYYLVDVIGMLKKARHAVYASIAADPDISIGINNQWELQQAQQKFNRERMKKISLEKGVTFMQPESTTVEWNVDIGRDSVVYPCTYLASGTTIGKNCQIGPYVFLKEVVVDDNEQIVNETRIGSPPK
jgi:bifunctional UDP-N-acetylglucosamine pyrophosphorylase/glucosamine-1-phosphate N-acetyltransferase